MGRKRTTVGTVVSRVIKDDQLPHSVKTGTTKALLQGGEVSEHILEELVSGIGVKADRMYAYGRDHYAHGLPSGSFTVGAEDIEDVLGTVLLSIENAPVTFEYVRVGPPNLLHIGWIKLIQSHGYNTTTNQIGVLTSLKGIPVYLDDIQVVVPVATMATVEPRSLELWGRAARAGVTPERVNTTAQDRAMLTPTPVRAAAGISGDLVRVSYVWVTSAGIQRDSFDIAIADYSDNAEYFQAKYFVGGVAKYWIYKDGAGLHPTLDALFDKPPIGNGSFFPFAYFRHNKTSEISNKTTTAYRTSKKLVKYLGIDYDTVAEALDENPDIADVQQAVLMMAVPANTTNELEQRYLWEFFNKLFLASSPEYRFRTESQAAVAAYENEQLGLRSPGIAIQDTRFKMSLDNLGIYKRRKAGNLGPVGTFDSAFVTENVSYSYIVTGGDASDTVANAVAPVTSHLYRKQVSVGYYDEIQVVELRTLFHIFGEYWTTGDDEDTILMVPLDKAITNLFSIPDKEVLYSRSLHFVFNSLVVTKVKWYQTGLFQAVMVIVAIVITVMSYGSTFELIAAAVSIGAYATAAWLVFLVLAEILIMQALFKLFVKAVGIEAAFVVAILAAAVGVANQINPGAFTGLPFAQNLLMVASGITGGIQTNIKEDYQDLLNSAKQENLLQKEQIKALETAQELLENKTMLSPFVIFGEKPDDYYNRTVHSGNIGVVGISAVSSYVDYALKLPELKDSIGELA